MSKSLAKTPAPAKDRIYGSKVNKVGSASSEKSAKSIKLSSQTIVALTKKLKEFRETHKTKKVSLSDLKAVYRRGAGAYSSSHRPTITGGAPNTRNAWAMARVNAFLRKAGGGEAKKTYVQDDDLLKYKQGGETKFKVKVSDGFTEKSMNQILNTQLRNLEEYKKKGYTKERLIELKKFSKSWLDKYYADGGEVEYTLWGVKNGEPDWSEDLLYVSTKRDDFEKIKKLASKDGYGRFRESKVDMKVKPDFMKSIKKENGGEIAIDINEKLKKLGFEKNIQNRYGKQMNEQNYVTAFYDKNKNIYSIRGFHIYKGPLGENSIGIKFDYDNEKDFFDKIYSFMNKYSEGGEVDEHKETYKKWKSLVNMSKSELEKFYNSEYGKKAGLTPSQASEHGIDSGRESARWIMRMKDTPVSEWTPDMWRWAKKQISFISRMSGNKGPLYDDKGRKTRKHTSLLIWGHNPEKHNAGGITYADKYEKNKWVNIGNDDISEFKDDIYDLIHKSYSYAGGNLEFKNAKDVANSELNIWYANDVDSDPNIDTIIAGKTTKDGIKITTMAQDGEKISKVTLLKKVKDLIQTKGFYAEVSKEIADKMNIPIIKDRRIIEEVVNKPNLEFNEDGSYDRYIHGKRVNKVLVGVFNKEFSDGGSLENTLYPSLPRHLTKVSSSKLFMPNVRGGWTKDKIVRYFKAHGSDTISTFRLTKYISEFDSWQDLKNHIYYHGTQSFISKGLKPSITMSEREAERIGGGGYGQRYFGVSLTKRKRTAESFAGMSSGVTIYPVILKRDAKVIERTDLQDASEIEDIIVELYEQSVDAVWIGGGEEELVVVNPYSILLYDKGSEYHNVYGGFKSVPLSDDDIKEMYDKSKILWQQYSEEYRMKENQEEKRNFLRSLPKIKFKNGGRINKSIKTNDMDNYKFNQLPLVDTLKDKDQIIIKESVFAGNIDKPKHLGERYIHCEVMSKGGVLDDFNLKVINSVGANPLEVGKIFTRPIANVLTYGRKFIVEPITKSVPTFKQGGLNPDNKEVKQYFAHDSGNAGGVLVGKRHSEGGIKAINKSTGQPLEMEGGEVVITRGAVSNNKKYEFQGKEMTTREILSKLNVDGGGVSFAEGGDVPDKMNCGCDKMDFGGTTMSVQDFINRSDSEYQTERLRVGIQKERNDHYDTLSKLNAGTITIEQALREIAQKEMKLDAKYPFAE